MHDRQMGRVWRRLETPSYFLFWLSLHAPLHIAATARRASTGEARIQGFNRYGQEGARRVQTRQALRSGKPGAGLITPFNTLASCTAL